MLTQKEQNLSSTSTYTPSDMDCAMLCASSAAYDIQEDGTLAPDSVYMPFSGFVGTPAVITGYFPQTAACLVGVNDYGIVVAFRGTEMTSPTDWMTDLVAVPVEVQDVLGLSLPGKVHLGIFGSVLELVGDLRVQLSSLVKVKPDLQVVFTGHSKGGGMATLAAMIFAENYGISIDIVETYASPMVGDQDFVDAYNKEVYQFSFFNAVDIVPLLPGAELISAMEAAAPAGLQPLLQDMVDWNYQMAGKMQVFIDSSGNCVTGLFDVLADLGDLKTAFDNGDYSAILAAHSHACGGGYMTAICRNSKVCDGQ